MCVGGGVCLCVWGWEWGGGGEWRVRGERRGEEREERKVWNLGVKTGEVVGGMGEREEWRERESVCVSVSECVCVSE